MKIRKVSRVFNYTETYNEHTKIERLTEGFKQRYWRNTLRKYSTTYPIFISHIYFIE